MVVKRGINTWIGEEGDISVSLWYYIILPWFEKQALKNELNKKWKMKSE